MKLRNFLICFLPIINILFSVAQNHKIEWGASMPLLNRQASYQMVASDSDFTYFFRSHNPDLLDNRYIEKYNTNDLSPAANKKITDRLWPAYLNENSYVIRSMPDKIILFAQEFDYKFYVYSIDKNSLAYEKRKFSMPIDSGQKTTAIYNIHLSYDKKKIVVSPAEFMNNSFYYWIIDENYKITKYKINYTLNEEETYDQMIFKDDNLYLLTMKKRTKKERHDGSDTYYPKIISHSTIRNTTNQFEIPLSSKSFFHKRYLYFASDSTSIYVVGLLASSQDFTSAYTQQFFYWKINTKDNSVIFTGEQNYDIKVLETIISDKKELLMGLPRLQIINVIRKCDGGLLIILEQNNSTSSYNHNNMLYGITRGAGAPVGSMPGYNGSLSGPSGRQEVFSKNILVISTDNLGKQQWTSAIQKNQDVKSMDRKNLLSHISVYKNCQLYLMYNDHYLNLDTNSLNERGKLYDFTDRSDENDAWVLATVETTTGAIRKEVYKKYDKEEFRLSPDYYFLDNQKETIMFGSLKKRMALSRIRY